MFTSKVIFITLTIAIVFVKADLSKYTYMYYTQHKTFI